MGRRPWALAVGLHDFLLDEHDHVTHGTEWTLAQVWSPCLTPVTSSARVIPIVTILDRSPFGWW